MIANVLCSHPLCLRNPSVDTTQLHPSSKPKKVTTCFVLDDCGDNFDTFVNTAGGKVSFSVESTRQTPSTPIAPIVVDTRRQNILDVHATDDDDESWSSEDHHKSGWNTRFNGGTYRGMLFGVDCKIIRGKLCHLSGQETCQQTCVNFSLGHKNHYHIDATTSIVQRKTDEPSFVVSCPSGCEKLSCKVWKEQFVRSTCKIRDTVLKERRTPRTRKNISRRS